MKAPQPPVRVELLAPLSGVMVPLETVPDPVFAQKMVGDGVSIDPSDAVLIAACDGEVIALHAAGHAVTLRTPQGIELLMHIGIDTVNLKGEGFRPRVKIGDRVPVAREAPRRSNRAWPAPRPRRGASRDRGNAISTAPARATPNAAPRCWPLRSKGRGRGSPPRR